MCHRYKNYINGPALQYVYPGAVLRLAKHINGYKTLYVHSIQLSYQSFSESLLISS
jgi:hypothetical protein